MCETHRSLIALHEAEFVDRLTDEELAPFRDRLPAAELARYDSLKQRFGATILAPMESGGCPACHMSLSVLQRSQIDHSIVNCESCGRMIFDPELLYDGLYSSLEIRDSA